MYENIGGKIKGFAKFIAWFGIIGSVIGGIAMISQGSNYYYRSSNPMVLPGILTIIAGSLASWISSWFTYGFGELIEKASEIAANTSRKEMPDKSPDGNWNAPEPVENTHSMLANGSLLACGNGQGECSLCKTRQSIFSSKCIGCGATFEDMTTQNDLDNNMDTGIYIQQISEREGVCSNCKTKQRYDRSVCFHCGKRFADHRDLRGNKSF